MTASGLILAALFPALVALGVLLTAGRARARVAGLAVALAYLSAHITLLGLMIVKQMVCSRSSSFSSRLVRT